MAIGGVTSRLYILGLGDCIKESTLLTLPQTCNPDARGSYDNDNDNDNNRNDLGGDLAHARVTQDLVLIPCDWVCGGS